MNDSVLRHRPLHVAPHEFRGVSGGRDFLHGHRCGQVAFQIVLRQFGKMHHPASPARIQISAGSSVIEIDFFGAKDLFFHFASLGLV